MARAARSRGLEAMAAGCVLQLGEGNPVGYTLKAHGEQGVVAGERRPGGGLGFGLCVGLTEARSA